MEAIVRINNLINSLPKRDIPIGFAYLKIRDFESLQELVDSAIVRTIKNLHSESKTEEYTSVNLSSLRELKAEVDNYSAQINGIFNDFEDDYNEEEEYY